MKKALTLSERIVESVAIGTIYTGTVTTVLTSSSSSLTGLTLVAVGIITYAAVRVFSSMGYETTTHVSPKLMIHAGSVEIVVQEQTKIVASSDTIQTAAATAATAH